MPLNFTGEEAAIILRAVALDDDNYGNWGRRMLLQAARARLVAAGSSTPPPGK